MPEYMNEVAAAMQAKPGYFAVFDGDTPVAFYNELVHGVRQLPVLDTVTPSDVRQMPYQVVTAYAPNPDTLIPLEAQPITEDDWLAFIGAADGA